MESKESSIFSLVWTLMPLSQSELKQIPLNHRIRPYLIFKIEDDFFGFPCSSNIYNHKSRYSNDRFIIGQELSNDKTLVNLERVYEIPIKNFRSFFKSVNIKEENEIIKRIQANFQFSKYPQKIVDHFKSVPVKLTCGDMIIRDNQLYGVVGTIYNELVLVPIYKYPIDNSVECSTDGLLYYADVDNTIIMKGDDTFKYCTKINNLLQGYENMSKKDIKRLMHHYYYLPRIKLNYKFNRISQLQPGMIIDYMNNNKEYKMIVLRKGDTCLDVIIGEANTFYSNYEYVNLPIDANIVFEISGVLANERLKKLCEKFLTNEQTSKESMLIKNNKNYN